MIRPSAPFPLRRFLGETDRNDQEMLGDIAELLRQRSTPGLPLADLFLSILNGEGTRSQRSRFGYAMANMGRKIIVKTIEEYARKTQNWSLLHLLDRIQNPDAAPVRQQPVVPQPPKLPPDERTQKHRRCLGKKWAKRLDGGLG